MSASINVKPSEREFWEQAKKYAKLKGYRSRSHLVLETLKEKMDADPLPRFEGPILRTDRKDNEGGLRN
jgi:hypothetical protein